MESLHVMIEGFLQSTNESSRRGGAFKYKTKKLGILYI
jgi:hypothetical protein